LALTIEEDEQLTLPQTVRLGLIPGDILALRLISEIVLRLDLLRDFYAYSWNREPLSLWSDCLERFLTRPLTAVAAEGRTIPLPPSVFPLRRGEKVHLCAMDRGAQSQLYLLREKTC
jgi:hypothetical protein